MTCPVVFSRRARWNLGLRQQVQHIEGEIEGQRREVVTPLTVITTLLTNTTDLRIQTGVCMQKLRCKYEKNGRRLSCIKEEA